MLFRSNARSNLSRLSAGDQKSIAADLISILKPSALAAWRDALDARIAEIDGENEA